VHGVQLFSVVPKPHSASSMWRCGCLLLLVIVWVYAGCVTMLGESRTAASVTKLFTSSPAGEAALAARALGV